VTSGTQDQPVTGLMIPGHWDFRYNYFAGDAASRFFHELGNRRLMGTRCPSCQRVLVPARSFCDACFVDTTEWVEVGQRGRLETFTILATKFPGLPDPPVVIGYVTPEGASTALLNFVLGIDLGDIDAAAEKLLGRPWVNVRFRDQLEGRITDFFFEVEQE